MCFFCPAQATLQAIEDEGRVRVVPSPRTVAIIQDKFAQKEHFAAAGVPLPAFAALRSAADVDAAAAAFGFPLVLKSRRLAYDGRGNATARSAAELPAALEALGGIGCVPPVSAMRFPLTPTPPPPCAYRAAFSRAPRAPRLRDTQRRRAAVRGGVGTVHMRTRHDGRALVIWRDCLISCG
jgi:hypothetical protein